MPNSLAQTVELTCPQCHRPFTADVWLIVDVDKRPDLLQRIRVGDLHAILCPHCGYTGQAEAPLLLYFPHADPATGQPPLLFSPAQRTTAEQDQAQAGGLLSVLAQVSSNTWQDRWREQIVAVPRRLLAALLNGDSLATQTVLGAEFAASLGLGARLAAEENSPQVPPELTQDLRRAKALNQEYLHTGNLTALDGAAEIWRAILNSPALAAANKRVQLTALNDAGNVLLRRYWAHGRLEDLNDAIECYQQAIKETPDGSPDLPMYLNNLGNGLSARYARAGQVVDLDEAVRSYQRATKETPDGSPDLPMYLNNLGIALRDRYARTGQLADLEAAVHSYKRAIKETLDGSLNLPAILNNLGTALRDRYVRLGQVVDLEEAICSYQRALNETPAGSPNLPFLLTSLGNGLRDRHARTGQMADLEEAVRSFQRAVNETPAGSPNLPSRLNNLGNGLSARYARTGQVSDLDEAVHSYEQAVQRTSDGSPDVAMYLNNLGSALRARYARAGQLADLEAAVHSYERAVAATPDGSPNLSMCLNNLGTGLNDRYVQLGEVLDLEEAICSYQRAVTATPDGSPNLSMYLNNLGTGLSDRYVRLGQVVDLDEAVHSYEQAVTKTPDGSPDLAMYLNNLGTGLRARYARLGQVADLDEAIRNYQRAVNATPAGSPYLPGYLNNLGNGLRDRYARWGQVADLDEAVRYHQQAVKETPKGSPNLPSLLANLGNRLRDRYARSGQVADLDEAVRYYQRAVKETPKGSPDLAMHLNNLGIGLRASYARRGQVADLEEAVRSYERAVRVTPDNSPKLSGYLNNLGTGLRDRYARTGQLADLQEAVRSFERAVAATPDGSPDLAAILNNLGTGLRDRYAATGQLADLQEAVRRFERAVAATPDGSPDLASHLNNLGGGLSDRYARTGQLADLQEAVRSFRTACTQGALIAPSEALNAARNWGRWALGRGAWAEAVEAYEYGSATGRLLLARHWSRAEKTAWLRELQAMPAPFAYALAQLGRLEEAVLAAEHGRARLLAEALERTRRDLDLLPARGHPHLLARYQAVVQELNQLTRADAAGQAGGLSGAARLDAIAAANGEFEAVVTAIRAVEGYADFLVEPAFTEVAALAAQQPLVYLLATAVGGLALIVHGGAVQPLWLADLTEERLDTLLLVRKEGRVTGGYLVGQIERVDELRQHLPPLLAALGELVAQPLAAALHSLPGAPAAVTLIPSGRLALLPLHAAPLGDGRTLQDAFAVRYFPSSVAAAAAERRALLPGSRPLLALADPQRPGLDPAWFTDWLGGRAAALFGGGPPLLYEQAGEEGLRAQLVAGAPTHLLFGCHGIFNAEDPLASGLELADGRLTLAQLLDDVRLDGVDLVTLCACQTSITDFNNLSNEALGLPAAILQAGARRVAGTLWPVHALATVLLLAHFYELLAAGARVETALAQSAAWLRTLSSDEAERRLQTVLAGTRFLDLKGETQNQVSDAPQPFAHPMYWAAFTCTGAGEPT